MILHQGAGDMDNRYFPGTDLETMPGIGCSFKSRHFGFDFILGGCPRPSGQVGSTHDKEGWDSWQS
jgi:hypothetical protein